MWTFAKALAQELAARHPALMTSDYKVANASGGPRPHRLQPERLGPHPCLGLLGAPARRSARVSTPVTWAEVGHGVRIEDFRLDNVRARLADVGDLWKPLVLKKGRVDLRTFLK